MDIQFETIEGSVLDERARSAAEAPSEPPREPGDPIVKLRRELCRLQRREERLRAD